MEAFRNIGEVSAELGVRKHVLRFWEAKFPQLKPMKRGGGRRYYRPADIQLLRGIRHLLQTAGYTIKGVQKILREQGVEQVKRISEQAEALQSASEAPKRGRRGKAEAATSSAAAASGPARSASTLRAAIAELNLCRDILMGKAVDASSRRRVKPRRAAAP